MADTKGMAKTSTRSLWKGAITFGLVHIPIGLYSATEESDVNFDWLDRRTLDPVGYKRINKRTGKEIDKEDVVSRSPGLSAMPEGFDAMLTKRELRDLVEFIATIKPGEKIEPQTATNGGGHGG